MDFKTLTLADKDQITPLFQAWNHYENAESSFANLFIWRKFMNLQFCVMDGAVYLLVERKSKHTAFMPMAVPDEPLDRHVENIVAHFRENGWEFIAFCTEQQVNSLVNGKFGSQLAFRELMQSNEYIYDAQSLRTLSGKTYQKKRNHINHFLKNYGDRIEYQEFRPEHADECLSLYDTWLEHSASSDHAAYERDSVVDALMNFEYLGLTGAIVRLSGKLEAFTLGERLTGDMALIHIEKANRDIIGLYAFINQQFLLNAFPDVSYVNREEDLGLEGLRKAKMSYYPIRFIRKYEVKLK